MLIDGRGNITAGVELNQPNTLFGSCSDGLSGSYHTDESLDRMRIRGWDGFTLQPNRVAVIDAWVWPWQQHTFDHLDIYVKPTISSSNDDWHYVTNLDPYAANQLNQLSYAFILPSSDSGRLAIRGVFRYSGAPSTCDSSSYSDHDDFVITLGTFDPQEDQAPALIWQAPQPALTTALSGVFDFVALAEDDNTVTSVHFQVLDSNQVVVFDSVRTSGGPQYLQLWDTQTVNSTQWHLPTSCHCDG